MEVAKPSQQTFDIARSLYYRAARDLVPRPLNSQINARPPSRGLFAFDKVDKAHPQPSPKQFPYRAITTIADGMTRFPPPTSILIADESVSRTPISRRFLADLPTSR